MRIDFSGACTVERMEELQQLVHQAAATADDQVEIGLAQIVDVDLAFFQLLHGAKKSLDALGKALVCAGPLPAHLTHKAALCGFSAICAHPGGEGSCRHESAMGQPPVRKGESA